MRIMVTILLLLSSVVACKSATTSQAPSRNADIVAYGKACMANVMADHRAGRITSQQAEYGLAKCESDANAQAQLRYLTTAPR